MKDDAEGKKVVGGSLMWLFLFALAFTEMGFDFSSRGSIEEVFL